MPTFITLVQVVRIYALASDVPVPLAVLAASFTYEKPAVLFLPAALRGRARRSGARRVVGQAHGDDVGRWIRQLACDRLSFLVVMRHVGVPVQVFQSLFIALLPLFASALRRVYVFRVSNRNVYFGFPRTACLSAAATPPSARVEAME